MAVVKPFIGIRPHPSVARLVAALPYDVYNRAEAKKEVEKEPLSFLCIDRPETAFPDDVDANADCVYEEAARLLTERIETGCFIKEEKPCYYLYEMEMNGRSQTGIVAVSSIDDYLNHVIKKHENTREEKELDRIRHVDMCNAQTGPIFLAYRGNQKLNDLVIKIKQASAFFHDESPLYDFMSTDEISHRVWVIDREEDIRAIEEIFREIKCTYIADGHHRAASAVKVGGKRREENPDYTGKEPFNYFLSVLFPAEQLMIMPYHRVVEDLNGQTKEEFLDKLREKCQVIFLGKTPYQPEEKGSIGMYLEDGWYRLNFYQEFLNNDPIKGLDVSILQDQILAPLLGVGDPRTDQRIDFIGGIRGLSELEKRVHEDMKAAFSLYPTSMNELMMVADAGLLMPPKSTWFEPKLRSGLLIHSLND